MTITDRIQQLKREKNAVILAHYYVNGEVQAIADDTGDSYYLSQAATKSGAERIIFCGVSFMGESAKILNPQKRVFMPDGTADCAMAHMANLEKVKEMRKRYEDLAVVCYINSTAEIKTYSDVCVTSANAVKIVRRLKNRNIFFLPDGNLGRYVAKEVPEKNVMVHDGYCPIHAAITPEDIKRAKAARPGAEFLVHPECTAEVLALADYVGSTSGIIRYAAESGAREFLIGTETGVFYELRKQNPDKQFFTVRDPQVCQDMKTITLEKIAEVLEKETNEVFVEDETRKQALLPLQRMLELAAD